MPNRECCSLRKIKQNTVENIFYVHHTVEVSKEGVGSWSDVISSFLIRANFSPSVNQPENSIAS